MIYEAAAILRAEIDPTALEAFKTLFLDITKEFKGEVLLADDWGTRTFAQPKSGGKKRGRYLYFMYQSANGAINAEIERRWKIHEDVMGSIIVKLGDDKKVKEQALKVYKNPFLETELDVKEPLDSEKGKKFAKRRSCWFTVNKLEPDWKRPLTISWLVNEFGKINPQRVSGISAKYHRKAVTQIKRARVMGVLGYLTSDVAH
jgi:small subunit ribosomal protein S6